MFIHGFSNFMDECIPWVVNTFVLSGLNLSGQLVGFCFPFFMPVAEKSQEENNRPTVQVMGGVVLLHHIHLTTAGILE